MLRWHVLILVRKKQELRTYQNTIYINEICVWPRSQNTIATFEKIGSLHVDTVTGVVLLISAFYCFERHRLMRFLTICVSGNCSCVSLFTVCNGFLICVCHKRYITLRNLLLLCRKTILHIILCFISTVLLASAWSSGHVPIQHIQRINTTTHKWKIPHKSHRKRETILTNTLKFIVVLKWVPVINYGTYMHIAHMQLFEDHIYDKWSHCAIISEKEQPFTLLKQCSHSGNYSTTVFNWKDRPSFVSGTEVFDKSIGNKIGYRMIRENSVRWRFACSTFF